MYKGITSVAIAIVFMALMLGVGIYATDGGRTFVASLASMISPASVVVDGQSCSLLQPEFGRYNCMASGTNKYSIAPTDACGLFGTSRCKTFTCTAMDIAETGTGSGKSSCSIKCKDRFSCFYFGINTPRAAEPFSMDSVVTLDYGYTATLQGSLFEISYPQKSLEYIETSTGFRTPKGAGCSLFNILGSSEFNKLPKDSKREMVVGDSVNFVIRWKDYPVFGNVIKYNNVDSVCQMTGTGAQISSLTKYTDNANTCYVYPGNFIANVECCPGATSPTRDMSCGSDFRWKALTSSTGCCLGGLCSDTKCPNSGMQFKEGGNRVQYSNCNTLTGTCTKSVLGTAECDPMSGSGCLGGQICDVSTWKCVNKPQTYLTCIESGHECCLPGMFSSNIGLRSCDQAGKPGWQCINGICTVSTPIPAGQAPADAWGILVRFFTYWIIGSVLMFMVLFVLIRLPIPAIQSVTHVLKPLRSDYRILIAVSVLTGGLLAFLATPFLASVASMVGV